MDYGFIKKQDYKLSYVQENIEAISYSLVAYFVPLFLGHPQLFVGIIVNTALVLAALNLKSYKILPIIALPSLGVLTRGLIFGPYSWMLVFMIPFIWIGNSILVASFKYFYLHKKAGKAFVVLLSSALKALFLFLSAFLLFRLGLVPKLFLTAMGIMQLVTAFLGSVIAFGIQSLKAKAMAS